VPRGWECGWLTAQASSVTRFWATPPCGSVARMGSLLMNKLRKLPNLVDWSSVGNLKMKSDAGNSCRSASSVRKSRSLRSGLAATDTPTNAEKTSTITQTSFAMSTGTRSKSQRSCCCCCCSITTGCPSRVKSQQEVAAAAAGVRSRVK
jgi:hypothetical protein